MTSALRNFPVTSSAERAQSSPVLDDLSINTLRFLAVDEVEQANSGHPGLQFRASWSYDRRMPTRRYLPGGLRCNAATPSLSSFPARSCPYLIQIVTPSAAEWNAVHTSW